MHWKLWLVAIVLVVLGVFVLQNTRVVEFRFLFWKLEMSRALMMFAILGIGVALGWLLATLRRRP